MGFRRSKVRLAWAPLVLIASAVSGILSAGDATIPPEVLRIARMRQFMTENQRAAQSFTCLQTIERSRSGKDGKWRRDDIVRLEIALVNGKEVYSLPGDAEFGDKEIGDFVGSGTIGNGTFSSFATAVFVGNTPRHEYLGEETILGRRAYRYRYSVPLQLSGYILNINGYSGNAAYGGSFWLDAKTQEPLRLIVDAQDIAPYMPVKFVTHTIDFTRVRASGDSILLPQTTDTVLTFWDDSKSWNHTEYTHWRRYQGEVAIIFDDLLTTRQTREHVKLPAGLELEVRFLADLNLTDLSTGDVISATVNRDAVLNKRVVVPRESIVTGRLRGLETGEICSALVEWNEISFLDKRARFYGVLTGVRGVNASLDDKRSGLAPGVGRIRLKDCQAGPGVLQLWRIEDWSGR